MLGKQKMDNDFFKHIWEILVACLSSILSLGIWKYKKDQREIQQIKRSQEELKVSNAETKVMLSGFAEDIQELKGYMKMILENSFFYVPGENEMKDCPQNKKNKKPCCPSPKKK